VSDWVVAGFVSRVAERVTSAGEGLAAQLVDRYNPDIDDFGGNALRLQRFEPSQEFVEDLKGRLLSAPAIIAVDPARFDGGRRLVYGVAAVGSLASAAVLVALILRNRSVHRAAA
jgi:hypothetical protein